MNIVTKIKNFLLLLRITGLLVKFSKNMSNVKPALKADRLSQDLSGHFSFVNKVVASESMMNEVFDYESRFKSKFKII